MKALMTADTVGGVWSYAIELAGAMAQRGVDVALATMGGPLSGSQRRDLDMSPCVDVYESRYKLEWMEEPWEDVTGSGDWLLAIADEVKPDLVHLNTYAHGHLPWQVPVMTVGHSCVLSWWRAVRGDEAPADWARYRDLARRSLSSSDLVVAPTNAMLQSLCRDYGPLKETRVIANGRSHARFQPARKEPIVFAAGRLWDEAKNIGALAAVAERLPWPVFAAGSAEQPGRPRREIRGIQMLGVLDAAGMTDWLGRASIYAFPARYEPFGLSVLEAALSGCALVLGDIPSLRENWDGAAAFVSPDDPDELEGAVRRLIDDGAARGRLAAAARQRARLLTPERMALAYYEAYRELMELSAVCR